jgi:hypothetical protein
MRRTVKHDRLGRRNSRPKPAAGARVRPPVPRWSRSAGRGPAGATGGGRRP